MHSYAMILQATQVPVSTSHYEHSSHPLSWAPVNLSGEPRFPTSCRRRAEHNDSESYEERQLNPLVHLYTLPKRTAFRVRSCCYCVVDECYYWAAFGAHH